MTEAVNTMGVQTGPRPFFAALDGFRGLLALLVAIHHSQWFSYLNYKSFINEGFVLIDLFFVFSGFLLYRLYGRNLNTKADVADFIKRRFARLYPIHIFMLLAFTAFNLLRLWAYKSGIISLADGAVLPFSADSPDNVTTFISHIFLTHSLGFHDSLSYNWPSWTISVEFYVYFIFAALIVFWKPSKLWHIGVISVLIALVYWWLSGIAPRMDITYDYGFWRCLGGFFTGVIGAWLFMRYSSIKSKISRAVWTALELAALLAYLSFTFYFIDDSQFFIAPFSLFFVFVFAFDGGLISRFMSNGMFSYLAKISYSVYMTHALIAVAFDIVARKLLSSFVNPYTIEEGFGGDLYLIPYLITVIIVSHLTWRFVEGYGGRWLSRVIGVRRRGKTTS